MTREKPPNKTWDVWIEQLIQEAKDAGEFDRLEGKGKPIPGVEAPYDPDWWVKKLLEREKVSMLRVNARVVAGPPTRLAPLDADSVVREWRARRA